jgi:hypothetical protein
LKEDDMAGKKQIWTVRIIVHHDYSDNADRRRQRSASRDAAWLGEFLRYAGISNWLAEFTDGEKSREVFELRCPDPRGIDTHVWADHNAGRLRSFGLDAAAAPEWNSLSYSERQVDTERLQNGQAN